MSEILSVDYLKKLETLFSWHQFYTNRDLAVNRYSESLLNFKWNSSQFKTERYRPFDKTLFSNRKIAEKVQEEIKQLKHTQR